MRLASQFLKFVLAVSLASPIGHASEVKGPSPLSVLAKIDQFIDSLQESNFVNALDANELDKVLSSSPMDEVIRLQIARINLNSYGPDLAPDKLKWSEARAQVDAQALVIAREIFSQSIPE